MIIDAISLPRPYPCVCLANEFRTASTASFNTDLAGWAPSEQAVGRFVACSLVVDAILTKKWTKVYTKMASVHFENELPAYIINCQLQQFNCTSFSDQQGIELKKCDDKYEDAIERLLSANDPWRRILSAGRGGTSTQSRHSSPSPNQRPDPVGSDVRWSKNQKTRKWPKNSSCHGGHVSYPYNTKFRGICMMI